MTLAVGGAVVLVALPLLAKGVHLLIEKPICVTLEEAARILDAAAKADRIVQVGHIEHYNPVMSYLEKAVTDARRGKEFSKVARIIIVAARRGGSLKAALPRVDTLHDPLLNGIRDVVDFIH